MHPARQVSNGFTGTGRAYARTARISRPRERFTPVIANDGRTGAPAVWPPAATAHEQPCKNAPRLAKRGRPGATSVGPGRSMSTRPSTSPGVAMRRYGVSDTATTGATARADETTKLTRPRRGLPGLEGRSSPVVGEARKFLMPEGMARHGSDGGRFPARQTRA